MRRWPQGSSAGHGGHTAGQVEPAAFTRQRGRQVVPADAAVVGHIRRPHVGDHPVVGVQGVRGDRRPPRWGFLTLDHVNRLLCAGRRSGWRGCAWNGSTGRRSGCGSARLAHAVDRADEGVVVGEMPGLAVDGEVLGRTLLCPPVGLKRIESCRNAWQERVAGVETGRSGREAEEFPPRRTGWGWPGAAPRYTAGRAGCRWPDRPAPRPGRATRARCRDRRRAAGPAASARVEGGDPCAPPPSGPFRA